eukprot:SAG22_NODE_408_length_10942_cov_6.157429_2_plen_372_part_00
MLGAKACRSHFRNFLCEIDHPFIARAQEVAFIKEKGKLLVFREFAPRGSLKDRIHRKADPKQRWAAKYGFKGEGLKERQVALYGKQVLEAMAYLHTLGLPCTGIHTGNILMRASDWCQVADFEGCAVGLPPYKAERVMQSDILAFGHILYEMAVGSALDTAELVTMPSAPLPVQELLDRIFRREDGEREVTIKDLLSCKFFTEAQLKPGHEDALYIDKDLTKKLKKRLIHSAKEPKPKASRGEDVDYEAQAVKLTPRKKSKQKAIEAPAAAAAIEAPPAAGGGSGTPAAAKSAPPPPPPPPPAAPAAAAAPAQKGKGKGKKGKDKGKAGAPPPPPPPPPAASAPAPAPKPAGGELSGVDALFAEINARRIE